MGMTNCHRNSAIVIGVLELLLGIALVAVAFVFGSYGNIPSSQTPWWCGFPYLIPGILGIVAGATKNTCCMVASLVFNIILTILTAVTTVILIVAVTFWNVAITEYNQSASKCFYNEIKSVCTCNGQDYNVAQCSYLGTIAAVLISAVIVSGLCTTLALSGSILGCMATCCAPPDPTGVVVIQQQPAGGVTVVSSQTASMGYAPGTGYPPPGYLPQQQGPAFPPNYGPTHDKVDLVV